MSDFGSILRKMSKAHEPLHRAHAVHFDHRPDVAPMNYGYIFYGPIGNEAMERVLKRSDYTITPHLRDLYRHFNGMRVDNRLSIYGILAPDRLQPISLDYGNRIEIPTGLPDDACVAGVIHLTNGRVGYLISEGDGTASCLKSLLEYDVVKRWPSLYDAVAEFLPY